MTSRPPTAVAGATPPIEVVVAAMGPRAPTVTGELADGTLPFLAGPRVLAHDIVPAVTAAAGAADLLLAGDEDVLAAGVRRYVDAGATEVTPTQTDLGGDDDRRRTWAARARLSGP